MFAKLESLERKFLDLEQELADPTVFNDQDRYRKLTKAHSDLKPVVDIFRQYRELKQNLADNQELLNDADPDIREMAHEEIKSIEEKLPELEHDLKVLLLPTDPLDEKNIILEIRAGTGGEEAALFGGDLFRMYCRYAARLGDGFWGRILRAPGMFLQLLTTREPELDQVEVAVAALASAVGQHPPRLETPPTCNRSH